MRVWRVTKPKYVATAFDGEGAKRDGGRWNHSGLAMAYASDSAALATLELLVRLQDVRLLRNYVLLSAEIPDDAVTDLESDLLDDGWQSYPHTNATKDAGDAWLRSQASLALRVPSVVVPGSNVLVNPAHPRFRDLARDDPQVHTFDARLTG